MTGILTGSVYNDLTLKKNGFPGEHVRNRSVILIKTHDALPGSAHAYERAVLLLRNPYDSILAEFNRQAKGHLGHVTYTDFAARNGRGEFVLFVIQHFEVFFKRLGSR